MHQLGSLNLIPAYELIKKVRVDYACQSWNFCLKEPYSISVWKPHVIKSEKVKIKTTQMEVVEQKSRTKNSLKTLKSPCILLKKEPRQVYLKENTAVL